MQEEEQKKNRSIWHKIATAAFLCVVIPGVLLVGLEVSAGFSSKSYPTTLFVKDFATDKTEILRTNYQAGYRFFPGRLARKPLPEIMPAKKPEDRLRIFVLGESAARGEQLADFSFARILETVINRGSKHKKAEIINTGIPAINSWVLREFAREIVNYQPDLIIIYAGHNEFIGPYGPASVFGLNSSRMAINLGIWASSLHLIQLLRSDTLPRQLQQGWKGLEMFLRNKINATSPARSVCLSNWSQNIAEIMQIFTRRNIPVVWCRVPVNLRDCPPFISDEDAMPESTKASINQLAGKAEEAGLASLKNELAELTRQAPEHALVNYLNGLALYQAANFAMANEYFKKALANDCFRVRIGDEFNDAAAELAKQYNAITADVEAEFKKHSQGGIIGKDLVYDHVHLTDSGHYHAANSIFKAIKLSEKRVAKFLPESFPDMTTALSWAGLTGHDRIQNLEHIISSLSAPPFSLQSGNKGYLAELKDLLQQEKDSYDPVKCLNATRDALNNQPANAMLYHRMAMLQFKDREEARQNFISSLAINPCNIDTLNNYALLLISQESNIEAEKVLSNALALAPDFARAHFNLGVIKARSNDKTGAIKHYQEALQSDPSMAGAWRNLANLYFNDKNFTDALAIYQRAVIAVPQDLMAHLGMGNCLMELQQFAAAANNYQNAVSLFASSPLPSFSLGMAHSKQQKYKDAAAAFLAAGRLGYSQGFYKAIELHLQEKFRFASGDFLELSEQACTAVDFSDPWLMQIYASALLEVDKTSEAIGILHRARDLAHQQQKLELAGEIEANIKALQQN